MMGTKNYLLLLLTANLILSGWLAFKILLTDNCQLDLSNEVLKVRGLVVTDSLGIERVIIGAPLPDPNLNGYRVFRGTEDGVSGVMLYDAEGQERGGYVTDNDYGNIFLTLDSKTQQNALFIADPFGGAALQVWGKNGNKISLAAGDDGLYMDLLENNRPLKFETNEE